MTTRCSSLVLTYSSFTLPLGVWLMWGFFKSFPFEIEEAALVDGCSRWQAIYRVILPITLPGVLTVAIFSFLLAWSDFVFSLILISKDESQNLPTVWLPSTDAYDANWGELMAGSTMIFPPPVAALCLPREILHSRSKHGRSEKLKIRRTYTRLTLRKLRVSRNTICTPPPPCETSYASLAIIVAPGAYDCLTAKIIEREGFPAVYMTGAGTAVARVGKPDLGFTTLSEMLASASAITSTIRVPLIADADTGYGGALNVYRTIREYERAGVAALHIEDQTFPKRCGHLDGKEVVSLAEMVTKIRAACEARTDPDFVLIVRTDALAVTGLDDTIRRSVAYAEAGADVLFVEALRTQADIDRVRREIDLPLLYNFVEHGKSPLLPVPELAALGFKMVIFPGSIMLSVCTLAQRLLREIRQHGTTARFLDDMQSVQEFFDISGFTRAARAGHQVGRGRLGPSVSVSCASPHVALMRRHYVWLGVERGLRTPLPPRCSTCV